MNSAVVPIVTNHLHLRRRQASLTIGPLHQSFAVSVCALFSGRAPKSPQQIDQQRGARCTTKTKSRAFLAAYGCASGTTGTTKRKKIPHLRGALSHAAACRAADDPGLRAVIDRSSSGSRKVTACS